METLERKAIEEADFLFASEEGYKLLLSMVARWQFNGFIAGIAHKSPRSKALWSVHHHMGYVLASKLSQGARK